MGPKEAGGVADERLTSGSVIDAEIDDIEMDEIVGLGREIVSMLRLVRGMLRVVDKDGTSTLMLGLEDVNRSLRGGDMVGRLVRVGSVEYTSGIGTEIEVALRLGIDAELGTVMDVGRVMDPSRLVVVRLAVFVMVGRLKVLLAEIPVRMPFELLEVVEETREPVTRDIDLETE